MDLLFRSRSWYALVGGVMLAACGDETTAPPPPPDTPTNVVAQATSATTARVTWTVVANATSYVIQRAAGATGDTYATVGAATTGSFDDTGLTAESQYRYRVASVAGTATSGYSTEASVMTPPAVLPTVDVTTDITVNTAWTSDKVYVIKGFVHVANGAVLTIEAGTKIIGDYNTLGSALFVLRGSRIVAQGTADRPIVFTSSRDEGQRQAGDWGGLILIGNGVINRTAPVILEGTGTSASNPAVDYAGGTNNADNSGVLRYVRVEFAGYATAPDTELNTLTLAAIGSGTVLEYVQSLNGLDDSFEFFGGAVDGKYLVSYNSGDDHFDMSGGYVGRLQHLIAYQTRTVVPRPTAGNVSADPQGIENDGCAGANCPSGQTSQPYTIPLVANATLIGPPATVTNSTGNVGMMLRRGTGGYYVNHVASRWSRAGASLRDQTTLDGIAAGRFELKNTLFTETPVVFQAASGTTVQGSLDLAANALEHQATTTATSLFVNVPATEPANGATFDFTPVTGSPAASGGMNSFTGAIAAKAGTVVTPTSYRGAAAPGGPKWWQGWTRFLVN